MSASVEGPRELGALTKRGHTILDKYRVEGMLGVGGMGAVISAFHIHLEERVAIKFLIGNAAKRPEMVRRFLREGKAAIKIRSEHCVRVFDVGTMPDGRPYMVMEELEGCDLENILVTRGALSVGDAVDYVLQACEALAEAHALGMVHRDLKPANLFLTKRADGSPCVKVLDFGMAKQPATQDAEKTSARDVFGSPMYMSPEQMRSSRDVDARADIWALGTVLYEMVTTETPFNAASTPELCDKILREKPRSIRSLRPEVPEALDHAVQTALQKDRERRFDDIGELAAAIAPFGTESARKSSERITRVLAGGVRGPMSSDVIHASRGPNEPMVARDDHETFVDPRRTYDLGTTSHTVVPRRGRSRFRVVAGVVAIMAAAILLGAVIALAQRSHAAPPAPSPLPSQRAKASAGGAASAAASTGAAELQGAASASARVTNALVPKASATAAVGGTPGAYRAPAASASATIAPDFEVRK